jgi:large subunit ribosomal protein L18
MKIDKGTKTEKSKECGKLLAKAANKKNIKNVVFDRGGCRYHGRIKAFAEGAREGGLQF